ncbi:MAG: methyltransferase domain-containing protein [Alphaproteobacteria bacterium]|nr:methyltransferase domain-containing protein [Alphaproteobacteria bacterium]
MDDPARRQDPAQDWDSNVYATNARFVADLAGAVVCLLAPQPGERILDLGCGDGALTKNIAEAGADVLGVDASEDLVRATRELGLTGDVVNGHHLEFAQEFDAVFSNAALHWMRDPEAVIDGVKRAMKPGGRFVAEFGGAGNVAKIIAAIDEELSERGKPGLKGHPWYFPTPDTYRALLEQRGFRVDQIGLIDRPTRLPGDVGGWLDTFADSFLRVLDPADRGAARDAIVARLHDRIRDEDGVWWADYVRLRFRAFLEY